MENKVKMSAKDFFLHLGSTVALYFGAIMFISLIFALIDSAISDPLTDYYGYASDGIRWFVSSLIIVYPLYILLNRAIYKENKRNPGKAELAIRKWLVYFTLFIAGATVTIDLIALINTFLGGEITLKFILKVITIFIVAGAVFAYYLRDLKGQILPKRRSVYAYLVALIILVAIVFGFIIVGSPAEQRKAKFDRERIDHLSSVQWKVVDYYQSKGRLPSAVEDLNDEIGGFNVPTDPVTDEQYKYAIQGSLSFSLCANFETSNADEPRPRFPSSPERAIKGFEENWTHEVGETCFERTIDPDLYPIRKN